MSQIVNKCCKNCEFFNENDGCSYLVKIPTTSTSKYFRINHFYCSFYIERKDVCQEVDEHQQQNQ
jgi:hypothetical protein